MEAREAHEKQEALHQSHRGPAERDDRARLAAAAAQASQAIPPAKAPVAKAPPALPTQEARQASPTTRALPEKAAPVQSRADTRPAAMSPPPVPEFARDGTPLAGAGPTGPATARAKAKSAARPVAQRTCRPCPSCEKPYELKLTHRGMCSHFTKGREETFISGEVL